MTQLAANDRVEALEQAFALFNDTSRHLQSAWTALEARAAELTRERDAAHQARLEELAAKERLAERLQSLLESLPGAVLMLDADGRVGECNAGARELLGEPLVGHGWPDIAARALRAKSEDDGTPRLADGRRLSVSRQSTSDGGRVLLITDDSEAHARRSGVERQRQSSQLDANNARLAHQLRTPLSTAVLYLSRIADGGLDGATAQRLGAKALMRLHELQELIDGMLAFVRGEHDVSEVIQVNRLMDELRQSAAARMAAGARLHIGPFDPTVSVRGQRSLLVSAMLNLLDNAFAVSDDVYIDIHADADGVAFVIEDHGPGIDEASADRIFDPFFTTRHDGTGLGLAMARSFARAHGGDLILIPSSSGARFLMSLPSADSTRALPSGDSAIVPMQPVECAG